MIATLIELPTWKAEIEINGRILPLNQRALYFVEVPSPVKLPEGTRLNGRTKYIHVYCIAIAIYPFVIALIWHFEFKFYTLFFMSIKHVFDAYFESRLMIMSTRMILTFLLVPLLSLVTWLHWCRDI